MSRVFRHTFPFSINNLLIMLCVFSANGLVAQHSIPDSIKADGLRSVISTHPDTYDPSEIGCMHGISNFTQREGNFGEPISEKTEVCVLFNEYSLKFYISCYQKNPKSVVAKYMQRDFDISSDDNFRIIISPFNDGRTGYLFAVNPNGARADELVSNGEEGTLDWNGVWNAKCVRNDSGWFALVEIPFNTLQFSKASISHWGINFERDIKAMNEQALWQGWSRDHSIFNLVNAGTLTGLHDISYAKHFELKPYALGGWEYNGSASRYPYKIGGDLNVNLTPMLKLNLTANTDFAQVESDRIPVNLTRFNVDYPEKREFFLEGYDFYGLYLGNSNNVFYTRSIGIENLRTVPIIAGARLFGKVGKNNIGFLNIEEGKLDTIPEHNSTVFRYKRDIGEQSWIGGIITNKMSTASSNQVIGIDGAFSTSHFLHEKNLVLSGTVSQSMTDLKQQSNSLAYRLYCDYPNDLIDQFIAISSIQRNYDPQLGFLQRGNYEAFNWHIAITPRVFTKYGIRQLDLKAFEIAAFRTQSTHEFESFYNESRPLGAIFKSGESFQVNLQLTYDRIDVPFDISDNVNIPIGKYWMQRTEFYFSTFQSRRIWASLKYNWGTFYTGRIRNFEGSVGININKHLNFNTDYAYNNVILPNADITTNELANYVNYAFTTKIDLSFFTQWNSLDDILRFNLRLHWIPRVGSDLYVVYTQSHDQLHQFDFLRPAETVGVAKLVYRFTF